MAKKRRPKQRRKPGAKPAPTAPTAREEETDDHDDGDDDVEAAASTSAGNAAAAATAIDKAATDNTTGTGTGKGKSKKAKARATLPEVIVRSERTERPATPVTEPPAREPAFWFGFEVSRAKLAAARVLMFSLLALDAVMQLPHAPRYGAGDFNVAQLPFLDAIAPGRIAYGVGQLLMAYGFVLVVFGVATRVIVPVCAAIYAWLYFGSQLDSYQHHYLVALVLAIASFVPWERSDGSTRVRTWAVRLLLVQLAIMYVWAAISKMDLAWVDGSTLAMQMKGSIGSFISRTIGFKVAAVLVIAVELVLAATVWTRPGWKIAAPLGLVFHAGIVLTGLEIGLFAFLMIGIYALVIPDAIWDAMAAPFERAGRWLAKPSSLAWIVGTVVAVPLGWQLVRFEHAMPLVFALSLVPLAVAVFGILRKRPATRALGIAHVVAIVLWLAVDRTTTVTKDYYRFWGGSQRRIGSAEQAERAYRRVTEVAPDDESGHYQLGRLLIQRGATDEGLVHLREAQRLEPASARAFVEEARLLVKQGKQAEALEKAKQATYADPSHAEARSLVDSLTNNRAAPAATDDSTD